MRDEVDDDLSVTGGLENRAFGFQARANAGGVHQVAVVRDRDHALVAVHADRLRVEQRGVAGGGVTGVSDGERTRQGSQNGRGEDVAHQAHGAVHANVVAVGGGDAGGFLSTVLQRVQAEVG